MLQALTSSRFVCAKYTSQQYTNEISASQVIVSATRGQDTRAGQQQSAAYHYILVDRGPHIVYSSMFLQKCLQWKIHWKWGSEEYLEVKHP